MNIHSEDAMQLKKGSFEKGLFGIPLITQLSPGFPIMFMHQVLVVYELNFVHDQCEDVFENTAGNRCLGVVK